MRKFNNQQVLKALLLASGASMIAVASPVMAQADVNCQATPNDPACEGTRIVVTGSRIAGDFESTSPMVTVPEGILDQSSTGAIESNLNRLPQFVPAQTPTFGVDIQPTATNTPGAATISLRGIGANRNLVLIDGRRGTPGNASGVVDISTIPSAAIERIEVISGGASATYGADAVAGVTNFILKKNFEGLELDSSASITQEGDNFEYTLSGIMGSDFDDGRGNVSLAMSLNTREANYQRDRSWYQEAWADPTIGGTQFFIDFPAINFGFGNLPNFQTVFGPTAPNGATFIDVPTTSTTDDPAFLMRVNSNPGAFGQTIFAQPNGAAFTSNFGGFGNDRFTLPDDGDPFKRASNGTISQNNTNLYLILPLTRYNLFARGNYEINDWIGVFAQGLFSHVETFTRNEPGPIFAGWGATADPDNLDRDQLPDDLWALLDSRTRLARPGDAQYIAPIYNTPGDPATGLNTSVQQPLQPVVSAAGESFTIQALLPDDRETFTDVTTYNMIAGLEGSIPSTNFSYEAFVSHGISSTYAKQTGVYSLERTRALLNAPNFGEGFSVTGNPSSGGFGASTGTCTSGLNFYRPPAGGFSQDCLEAIRADLKNRSEVTQTIAEANVSGGLFELPAGELGIALGASFREVQFTFDNDTLTTQGTSFQDQALGIYPSGNVDASFDVHEAYGELLIPILSDIPAIQQFNIEVGGRVSDYSTTGTSYTYKVLGDWEVTDWLRVRGGYNRAERAPNIGELYLAAQQTFAFNFAGDPCAINNPLTFSANPTTNPTNAAAVQAICRQLMNQTGDPTADDFFYQQDGTGAYINGANNPSTFGFAFPTTVGNANLTPEKASTWTAGVVINSPIESALLSRFRLSVDWFSIKVADAIGEQTVAVALQQCFDPALNPAFANGAAAAAASQFCQLVPRNAQNGGLGNVSRTYVNNGRFEIQGVDVALNWGFDVGPGAVNMSVNANYLIDFKSAGLPVLPLVDYVGTGGTTENGLNAGTYEYRVLSTLGYSLGSASLSLQWQHLPAIEDATEAQFGISTPTTGRPSYNLFHLNGSYGLTDDVNLRFGIDNLFNQAPPLGNRDLSQSGTGATLPGGNYDANFYDTNGRRFYFGANLKF